MTRHDHLSSRPPAVAERLVRWSTPTEDQDCAVGDLAEEYRDIRIPLLGIASARRWYWSQALRSCGSLVLTRNRRLRPLRQGVTTGRTAPGAVDSIDKGNLMANLMQDVRYGIRTLAQTPTFTLLTVATLALAIGVNTAIFSMINVLLIKDLPLTEPETLAFIYMRNPQRNLQRVPASAADFVDFRRESASFSALGAVNRGANFVLSGLDEPLRVSGFEVTTDVFHTWGQEAVLGRTFAPGEDALGADRVALLAHGAWERRFGADPGVVGRVIGIDGYETTIIGVLDPDLEFGSLAVAEIWVPLRIDPDAASRDQRNLWITGRLKPGVTVQQARQEIAAIGARLETEYPETNGSWDAYVADFQEALAADQIWTIFYMLALTVSLVMAIACSNVATMMLARAGSRAKELALRVALGARRGRIVAQLLAESALLSLAAGLVGLLLARACLAGLVWLVGQSGGTNFFELLEIDRNVLVFTLAVSLAAPLLFGLVPALRASRPDLNDALKEGSRGNTGLRGQKGRRMLVAAEVAMALTLMVVAGVLIRTMIAQRVLDPGFSPDGVLTMRVDLTESHYPTADDQAQFFDAALSRVQALPNVLSATWMSSRPAADPAPQRNFLIEGEPIPAAEEMPWAAATVGDPHTFGVLGLPLVRGREFDASDTADGTPVVIINEYVAQQYWPRQDPLGRRIRIGSADTDAPWMQIVGIAGNVHSGDLENPAFPAIFLPMAQNSAASMALLARTVGPPLEATNSIREQVWAIDAEQPVGDVRTLERIIDDAFALGNALYTIFVAFAVFAVTMAAAGIYGVISYAVGQRTQEIGIRVALGAKGADVLGMVARQGIGMIAVGVAVGSVGAFVLGRILANAVTGVSGADPLTIAGVVVVFGSAALVATLVPARRAIQIDPVTALRSE